MLFIKPRQQSRQKDFYQDLMLKLDRSSTQVVSVKNYEIKFSKSEYTHILEYLCRVSFLTTLDTYMNYFKSRHRWCKVMQSNNTCILWPEIEIALVHHIPCRSYFIFTLRVFMTKELSDLHCWMNWRTLQPTSSSSWWVSHVLGFMHWTEGLPLQYKSNWVLE